MGTFTSTFTASNGAQSKTLVHEFNVTAAAATAPTVAQAIAIHSGTKAASISSTDGWNTPAADSLLLIGLVRSSSGVTKPSGWNDALVANPGTNRNIDWYWKKSVGTESTVSFSAFGAALLEIPDADTTNPIHLAAAQAMTGALVFPGLTPTIPNTLAIGAGTWNTSVGASQIAVSSGWTLAAAVAASVTFNPFVATQAQGASLSPVSGNVSWTAGGGPDGAATLLLIKPA